MTATAPHPYADFVHRVEKPARYLGGEFGAAQKDWSAARARVCLAFPDVYDIGMSHLGFKILYKILNDDPRTLADRCYAPWIDMEKQLRTRGLPLVSLENAKALREFDVVGFSLQFELTYTNVLSMLDLGGVPLRSADRGESDPLVIAGGPSATHPEPLADFLDAIVIGDGEERATEIALLWTELRDQGVPRRERLVRLAGLGGVYVPQLYAVTPSADLGGIEVVDRALEPGLPLPVQRNFIPDLNRFPFPDDGPVGGPEAIFDRMSIEIARGCTEGCRFCQAGMIYRPVRERDPDDVVETVVRAVKRSGYDEASLTSLSTADYSCIAPLIEKVTKRLAPEKVSLGVSSLRAYGLEETVLDDIRRVRASGITFAPEAGSQRMRDVVNKNVTEEQLMTTAERIFSRGWDGMKLYFMIGLPTEEESDVREIVRVGKRARDVGKKVRKETNQGGPPKVTVSVSTHVPKPHTPFQWCAMDPEAEVIVKQGWLRDEVKNTGVDLRMHDSRTSWLEGVFARGDRRLGRVLERAYRAGCRFDSWEDQLRIGVWAEAFEAEGIEPALYLGTLPVHTRLPWDHIDVGLEEGFLLREYRKAVKSRLSPPCGKVAGAFIHASNLEDAAKDQRKLVCYDCGVGCDLSAMRAERLVYLTRLGAKSPRVVPPPAPRPEPVAAERPEAVVAIAATDGVEAGSAAPPAPAPPKKPAKRAPPRVVQGEPRRYRFLYAKVGPMAYLSHLDLIRALPRSFRRLEIPIFYSSGFHPKPEMTFSAALSLGVASLAEVLDVKLTVDVDPAELAASLTSVSPPGLWWRRGVRLGPNDAGIAKTVDGARYAVGIPARALAAAGGEARLRAEVERVLAAPEIKLVRRFERGLAKAIDVKRFLRGLSVGDARATTYLDEARVAGDLVPLLCDVAITGDGGVKIAEVMEALFGKPDDGEPMPYHAVRAELGLVHEGGHVTPLDLEKLRELRPPPPKREALAAEA